MAVVLVGGGARSGKSRFALEYAAGFERRAFVATAQALDEEMAERIRRHRGERDSKWTTIEEPLDLAGTIVKEAKRFDMIVVDCLTLWLNNVMGQESKDAEGEIENLVSSLSHATDATVILITNEVGCGIVPDNAMARRYRDLAGEMNQKVAAIADEVYWVVMGVPVKIKPGFGVGQ